MTTVDDDSAGESERLQLYKLAVEMADRMSARRGSANAFFLTAQTTLITGQGVAFATVEDTPWPIVVALALAGVGLSFAWALQLRTYSALSRAKFSVIVRLEEHLAAAIYTEEWAQLGSGRRAGLAALERSVPFMFAALFVGLAAGTLLG